MPFTAADSAELAAALPLTLDLEPYRLRLAPLATAVLQGESSRTIEKQRELVLPDVWDGRLQAAAEEAIGKLRLELERKLEALAAAREELEGPARTGRFARDVVDRVLADLLDTVCRNMAALEQLERDLHDLPEDVRPLRAAIAARGAHVSTAVPPNELRAAIVRAARSSVGHVAGHEDADVRAAILVARTLATDERRAAARGWVHEIAAGSSEQVPLLAEELLGLLEEPVPADPGSDILWIQACIGLTLEAGTGKS